MTLETDRLVACFFDGAAGLAAALALRAALGVIAAVRSVSRWHTATRYRETVPWLSVGCGLQVGTVAVATIAIRGQTVSSITGQPVNQAYQFAERARILGWGIAAPEAVACSAGSGFRFGRRDNFLGQGAVTAVPIFEVLGLGRWVADQPSAARSEFAFPAGPSTALPERPVPGAAADATQPPRARTTASARASRIPRVPQRRLIRMIDRSRGVRGYEAEHLPSGRREFARVWPFHAMPDAMLRGHLAVYRKLARIEQRNVAAVMEVGRTDELAYVACEFLAGPTLSELIPTRMPTSTALDLLAQMSMALDALHAQGLVHGSLSPEDFRFREERVIVLASFGITQRVRHADRLQGEQRGSSSAPSPHRPWLSDSPRTDFCALGRIFFAMLTGRAAGEGGQHEPGRPVVAAPRLPETLSGLQPLIDRLVGVGPRPSFVDGAEVITHLLSMRAAFPFNRLQAEASQGLPARLAR